MKPTLIQLGPGVYYKKLELNFQPNEKKQVSILASRKQYMLEDSRLKECVIFYRKDVNIQKFISKQSKYRDAMESTKTHLKEKFSAITDLKEKFPAIINLKEKLPAITDLVEKSNVERQISNAQDKYIDMLASSVVVQDKYSDEANNLSKLTTDAQNEYEDFMDILNIVTQFKIDTKKYNNLSSDEKKLYQNKINLGLDLSSEAKDDEKLKIALSFNTSKKRYDILIEHFDEKTKNELMDDNFLASKKKILEEKVNSAAEASNNITIKNHKASLKIDFFKASLFEKDVNTSIEKAKKSKEEKKSQMDKDSYSTLSDPNDLSDKENIAASDTKNKLKDMVEDKLSPNTWSMKKASSPRTGNIFLNIKESKTSTISSYVKTNTDEIIHSSIIDNSEDLSIPDPVSLSDKESNAIFTNSNNQSINKNFSLHSDETLPQSRNRSAGRTIKAANLADRKPKSPAIIKNTDLDKDNSSTTNPTPLISSKSSTASGNDSMIIPTNEPKND
jgi:hypothetical protein